jgi:hypothetical protein
MSHAAYADRKAVKTRGLATFPGWAALALEIAEFGEPLNAADQIEKILTHSRASCLI